MSKDETNETTTNERRGRKVGTLVPGSMPWQLSQLEPGAVLLVPDAPNQAQQLGVAVSRYSAAHGGRYTIQVCAGMPLAFDGSAFKFYRVTRTE